MEIDNDPTVLETNCITTNKKDVDHYIVFSGNGYFLHSCRMRTRKQYRNVNFHQKTQLSLDDSPDIEGLQNAISGEGVLSQQSVTAIIKCKLIKHLKKHLTLDKPLAHSFFPMEGNKASD